VIIFQANNVKKLIYSYLADYKKYDYIYSLLLRTFNSAFAVGPAEAGFAPVTNRPSTMTFAFFRGSVIYRNKKPI